MDNGYVGIYDIFIDEKYRGNNYSTAIMNKILIIAKEYGVHTAYLQVVVGNKAAKNLYTKLGFEEIYKYWYRKII